MLTGALERRVGGEGTAGCCRFDRGGGGQGTPSTRRAVMDVTRNVARCVGGAKRRGGGTGFGKGALGLLLEPRGREPLLWRGQEALGRPGGAGPSTRSGSGSHVALPRQCSGLRGAPGAFGAVR